MAEPPRDWQLECLLIKQRGAYLLESGLWSDCSFLVGSEPNQVVVEGHKLFLAMASPVFEAMFYGGMADKGNKPVPIVDVQPEVFKALLEYIYTDNINISSFDKACELCYAAKKYMLPNLVKECTRYLMSVLSPKNACRTYEFARLFGDNELMDKCMQIFSTQTKEVLNDSSFQDVELDTVITLFSLNKLTLKSELELFQAAVRYSEAQDRSGGDWRFSLAIDNVSTSEKISESPEPSTSKWWTTRWWTLGMNGNTSTVAHDPQQPDDATQDTIPEPPPTESKSKLEVNKPTMRSVIEKIHFLQLTPEEFAEGPARSSLLTESEAFAVLMNILLGNCDVPMPNGFSTVGYIQIGVKPSAGVKGVQTRGIREYM